MKKNINAIKAIDWALRQGKDNTEINIEFNEVDAITHYGIAYDLGILPPHVAIWVNLQEIVYSPNGVDRMGYYAEHKEGINQNNTDEVILFYFL